MHLNEYSHHLVSKFSIHVANLNTNFVGRNLTLILTDRMELNTTNMAIECATNRDNVTNIKNNSGQIITTKNFKSKDKTLSLKL